MEHPVRSPRLVVRARLDSTHEELGSAVQYRATGASGGAGTGQPVAADGIGRVRPADDQWVMGDDICVGTRAQDCGGQKSEQLPSGIYSEFREAELCFHAP